MQLARIDKSSESVERVGVDLELSKTRKIPIRMYRYQGQLGCSVSAAMSTYCPMELQNWYKNTSAKQIDKRSSEAASFGSEGHALIEAEAKKEPVEVKEELRGWYDQWKGVQTQYKIEEEYSELMVFSKVFAFGGTIDRIGMFDGKKCVIDFKSGRFKFSDLWKTEAYRQAYIEMTGDTEVGCVVLYLPRPDLIARGEKPRHYTVNRHISCFSAFLGAYYTFKMTYFNPLLKAGMTQEDVFSNGLFDLYQRENGEVT